MSKGEEEFEVSGGRTCGADCSLLFDRDRIGHFFFGLSTDDFDRGLPILGSSPTCTLGNEPPSVSAFQSKGIGEGEAELLASPPLEFLILRNDLRNAFELLRLQFQLESSA